MNKENRKFWKMYAKLDDIEKFNIAYQIGFKRVDVMIGRIRDIDFFDFEDIQTETNKFDKENNIKDCSSPIGDIKELNKEKKEEFARTTTRNYIRKERGDLEGSRNYIKRTDKVDLMEFLLDNFDNNKLTIKDGFIKGKKGSYIRYKNNVIKLAKKCFIANNDVKMTELCDKLMVLYAMTNNGESA